MIDKQYLKNLRDRLSANIKDLESSKILVDGLCQLMQDILNLTLNAQDAPDREKDEAKEKVSEAEKERSSLNVRLLDTSTFLDLVNKEIDRMSDGR